METSLLRCGIFYGSIKDITFLFPCFIILNKQIFENWRVNSHFTVSVQVTLLWQQPLTRAYGGWANKDKKEQHKVSLLAICKCDQGVKLWYYLSQACINRSPLFVEKCNFSAKRCRDLERGGVLELEAVKGSLLLFFNKPVQRAMKGWAPRLWIPDQVSCGGEIWSGILCWMILCIDFVKKAICLL